MKKLARILQYIDLFQEIPETELETWLNEAHPMVRHYKQGERLFLENQITGNAMFLVKGRCAGELVSSYGKVLRLQEVKAPQLIAPFLFLPNPSSLPIQLFMLEETEIISIPFHSLLELFTEKPDVLKKYFQFLSTRFSGLTQRLFFLHFHTIRKKLAFYLLHLPGDEENRIQLPMKIQELADYFGVERPSLSNVLSEFVKKGLITPVSPKTYRIEKRRNLEEMLGE
ncbi:MAG: Crp/Fnr family transcriptional regulator [Spirochaetia bacterium]